MTKKIRVTLITALATLSLGTLSLPLIYAQDQRPPRRDDAEQSWHAPAPAAHGAGERGVRHEGRRPPRPEDGDGMQEMGMAPPPPPPDGDDDRPEPPRMQAAVMRGKMAVEKIRRDEREIEQRKKALEGDGASKLAPETLQRRKRILELRTELTGLEKKELLDRVKEQTTKGLEELADRASDPEGGPRPEMVAKIKERLTKVQGATGDFDTLAKALDEIAPGEGGFRGPGGPEEGMEGDRGRRRFGPPPGGPEEMAMEGPEDGPMMGGRPPRPDRGERPEHGDREGFAKRGGPGDDAQVERIEREMEMLNHRIERLQQQMGQMSDSPEKTEKRAERKAAKKGDAAKAESPVIEGVPASATAAPEKM